MTDFEKYMESLDEISGESYLANLNRSLALVLDEFYQGIPALALSSITGFGFENLIPNLAKSKEEYISTYLPELEAKRKATEESRVKEEVSKMQQDVEDLGEIHKLMNELKTNP